MAERLEAVARGADAGRDPGFDAAIEHATTLQEALAPALDELLVARLDRLRGEKRTVLVVALLAVLAAAYLFAGFYVAVRRSVGRVRGALDSVGAHEVADLEDGLRRVAAGSLTRAVSAATPPLDARQPRRAGRHRGRRGGDPRAHRRRRSRPTRRCAPARPSCCATSPRAPSA